MKIGTKYTTDCCRHDIIIQLNKKSKLVIKQEIRSENVNSFEKKTEIFEIILFTEQ